MTSDQQPPTPPAARPTPPPGLVAYHTPTHPDPTTTTPPVLAPARPTTTRPAPPAPPTDPPRPALPVAVLARLPNRAILAAAAAIAAILITATIIVIATTTNQPPTTPVQAFYTALANRDTSTLLALNVCADSPLCDGAALTTGYQPPQDIRIGPVHSGTDPDAATVDVHYRLDATSHDDHIAVSRHPQGFLGHTWTIDTPPGTTLHLNSPYWTTAHLANIDATVTNPTTTDPNHTNHDGIWAPPGHYTITTTTDLLINPTQTTLTVTDNQPLTDITLTPTIRADLTQQITNQIHTRLDDCAQQPDPQPAVGTGLDRIHSCPFSYDTHQPFTDSPHWTINTYPTITLQLQPDATITITTTTPGHATLTYRWTLDPITAHWTTATTTTPITIAGTVELDNANPTWKP